MNSSTVGQTKLPVQDGSMNRNYDSITVAPNISAFGLYSFSNEHPLYRRIQCISTGIFVVLLIMIATLLVVYKSSNDADVVRTVIISSPTAQQYHELLNIYAQTLTCSCSEAAVPHGAFINVEYVLHPICSSIFVTDQWIAAISMAGGMIGATDLRFVGPQFFQALRSLCQLVGRTIQTELAQFYYHNHVSLEVISPILFNGEVDSIIQNFISSTTAKFSLSLQFIAETTQANALFSSIMTNYIIYIPAGSALVLPDARQYDNSCICSHTSSCTTRITIQDPSSGVLLGYVPGLFTGCYILDALRKSNLACLYNQTCLNNVANQLGLMYQMNIMPLNSSASQLFNPNMPVEILLDHLMVAEWKKMGSYQNYFDRCQPKSCAYSVRMREHDRVNMITTVLGIIGGIAAILNIVVFLLTNCLFEYTRRQTYSNTVAVQSPSTIQIMH